MSRKINCVINGRHLGNFTALGNSQRFGDNVVNIIYRYDDDVYTDDDLCYINGGYRNTVDLYINYRRKGAIQQTYSRYADTPYVNLTRHSKSHMNYLVHGAIKKAKPKNLIGIKHIGPFKPNSNQLSIPNLEISGMDSSKVLIKPSYGANGDDISIINTNEVNPRKYVRDKYNNACTLLWSYGLEEFIDNIDKEYRIVVSYGDFYIFPRDRKDNANGVTIATAVSTYAEHGGYGLGFGDIPGLSDIIGPDGEYFKEAIDILGIDFGSIDLFTTTDGKWGIFEWCPEFGIQGIHPIISERIHRRALNKYLVHYYLI